VADRAAPTAPWTVLEGDVLAGLSGLPDGSVRCCVTSPPYWGLRDYGHDEQIGLEPTPDAYVAKLVTVFREVRRVLADDGTLWLNLGDSYAATHRGELGRGARADNFNFAESRLVGQGKGSRREAEIPSGLKPKDLVGIPWRVAFALQADGWYLRQDIIWHKPNPMPESVTDRCTKAHEYIFLMAKSARYYYDAEAVKEENTDTSRVGKVAGGLGRKDDGYKTAHGDVHRGSLGGVVTNGRNRRSVWTVATQPFPGAHFAVMPEALVEPCVKAGSATGDTVLDPFAGSGTVGVVAARLGRSFIGCELNPEYAQMARARIGSASPLFCDQVAP